MKETFITYLDSPSHHNLTRVRSLNSNTQLLSQLNYTPKKTQRCLEFYSDKQSTSKKRRGEGSVEFLISQNQQLTSQNKRLKREIDKLNIEIRILKQTESNSKLNFPLMKSNVSDQSAREQEKQVNKLKHLVQMSYYSLKKQQQEKNIILEDNRTIQQLNKSLKQQVSLLNKQNNFLREETDQIKKQHKFQTDLLWSRVNNLQERIKSIFDKPSRQGSPDYRSENSFSTNKRHRRNKTRFYPLL